MDHQNHGGQACKMNMVFTWDYHDMCIVFTWWQVTSNLSFVLSFLAVVMIGAGYEGIRAFARRYESSPRRNSKETQSLFYALQVFWSFFIMLVFMTYNGFMMAAVTIGAFLGHYLFNSGTGVRAMACH